MITEDYVSFETAKLLKEKGFDEPCLMCYTSDGKLGNYGQYISYKNSEVFSLTAPTLQMAIKWLRKTHKIFFNVNYYNLDIGNEWLQLRINRLNKTGCEVSFEGFVPEEQYEKAIKYCLENLI